MRSLKTLFLFLITTVILATIFLLWHDRKNFKDITLLNSRVNNSLSSYPIKGIDISHYQKNIDWNLLNSNKDITFIIMKATEGKTMQDKMFKQNWSNSIKSGYITGAYHFFKHTSSGLSQAENFIRTVPVLKGTLPPIVDLEDMGLAPEKCKKELRDFLSAVSNHYKATPIIYTNYPQYSYYLLNDFKDYPIWIYDWKKNPVLPDNRPWTFWQYSQNGRRAGISGAVDLNCFNGNREQLIALTRKGGMHL